ncbi:MAG: hypothetical protein PHN42_06185 [Bacilli bacterium]|nr:hypothetical protein [Bacilli bacterium]
MKSRKKILIIITTSTFLLVILYNTSFGRYILNKVNDYILQSKKFYFNSTVLSPSNKTYSITNWDGVNSYTLTIDVNSKKNELISTDGDIEYDINVSCPTSVMCSLSKENGIIYKDAKTDSYVITITPIDNFDVGDEVVIQTSATSTSPYEKTMSATYKVGVENYGFSYKITDSVGSKYLTLELTNSKPYYEVITAFDAYQIGDNISSSTYEQLTEAKKANCVSSRVIIDFDPNLILLDLTNENYLNKISYNTQAINTHLYVNNFVFDMKATTNTKINFYKVDVNADYTTANALTVTLQN